MGYVNDFQWPIQIYYEDTDSGGVVYYANYLKFMERARTEWLRSLSIEQDELIQEKDVIFAVRKVEIDYLLAARFNDSLLVSTKINKVSGASIEFKQTITKIIDNKPTVICQAKIKIASLVATTFIPCALPEDLRSKITNNKNK